MYEITGVTEKLAVEALELAAAKLPIKTKIVIRSSSLI
jgi:ribosomal protein L16/L10AE